MAQNWAMPPLKYSPFWLRFVIGVSVVTASCASTAQAESQSEMLKRVQQQVGMDDHMPDTANPRGLQIQFKKMDELNLSQGHFIRYRAYVPAAQEGQRYSLAVSKIGAEVHVAYDMVYVNAKGLLMVHKPRPEQENLDTVEDADELDLAVQAARGEPVRFILATNDGKFLIPGTVVPYPIESHDSNCHLEARLGAPDGEAILYYIYGLDPKSKVPFQLSSTGYEGNGTFTANSDGHAVSIDFPEMDGSQPGTSKVTVAVKGCSTSVEISWGKGSYHLL